MAVALSLEGQARAKALELDVTELNRDDGLDTLISALDSLFKKETVDLTYEAYTNFDKYRKTQEVSMIDFILEYECRYNQCKKYEMTLPEAVFSFRLSDSANLSAKDKQLALTAASDLKFSSMNSVLKRIFKGNEGTVDNGKTIGISVKEESAILPEGPRTCEL